MQRPVQRDVAEVQADHTVIGVQRVRAELVEHAGSDPFIASRSQRRVGDLALQDRLDTDPRTPRHQADQDPPKTQPIRDPRPVTAQRMGPRPSRDQGLNRSPDSIYHFGFERAHDVGVLYRVVVVGSHSGSNPSQPDDRWMATYPRGS